MNEEVVIFSLYLLYLHVNSLLSSSHAEEEEGDAIVKVKFRK